MDFMTADSLNIELIWSDALKILGDQPDFKPQRLG